MSEYSVVTILLKGGLYLDTGMISNLDIRGQIAFCYNDTGALVASDERKLGCEWPVTVDGVEIGVADPGVFDIDEDLVWAWLLNWIAVRYAVIQTLLLPYLGFACSRLVHRSFR